MAQIYSFGPRDISYRPTTLGGGGIETIGRAAAPASLGNFLYDKPMSDADFLDWYKTNFPAMSDTAARDAVWNAGSGDPNKRSVWDSYKQYTYSPENALAAYHQGMPGSYQLGGETAQSSKDAFLAKLYNSSPAATKGWQLGSLGDPNAGTGAGDSWSLGGFLKDTAGAAKDFATSPTGSALLKIGGLVSGGLSLANSMTAGASQAGMLAGQEAGLGASDLAGWGGATTSTGGSLVGSNSFFGSTGNKIADTAANQALKGGITSGVFGGDPIQGALKSGVGSLVSGGVNSAINTGSNALDIPTSGVFDWAKGLAGNFASNSLLGDLWGNNSSKTSSSTQNTNLNGSNSTNNTLFGNSGGNMADTTSGITDWAKALTPFLGAYTANQQRNTTGDTFNKAYDLITTPSADQQKYRTQLSTLMDNPGSMNSSPVYQAMQDAGMNSVNRTAAAQGMLGSGNRLMDLMNQGQKTASQYYFPQQQALASLSGVQGDSAQRTLGAGSLIQGQTAQNEMQTGMLKELMKGFGVATPQDQLLAAMTGKLTGGASGSNPLLSAIQKAIGGGASGGNMDWLTQSGSTLDQAQLQDLLNQQGDFNWSGQDGVIGGSGQDQQLYDQWNPDWFSTPNMDTSVNTWGW